MGRFTCPECGKHRLIERTAGVTLYKEVVALRDVDPTDTGDPVVADYRPFEVSSIEPGEVDYYLCHDCESIIGGDVCEAKFFEWLREQGIWKD